MGGEREGTEVEELIQRETKKTTLEEGLLNKVGSLSYTSLN